MTFKEAITELKTDKLCLMAIASHPSLVCVDEIDIAVQAIEKQIPKKPINKTKCDNSTAKRYKNCNIVVCPLCNGRLKLKSKGKHCDKCGQALDWSDTK